MSWAERIKKTLSITTGDGKVYTPLYKDFLIKEIPYNIAEFEFPDVFGTKVVKGTPKGTRHEIDLIFQGENNIEEAKDFETSCIDPRAWNISHPIHGDLVAQPISLKFDYSGLNTCRITGTIVETIVDDYPNTTVQPTDLINERVESGLEDAEFVFEGLEFEPSELAKLLKNVKDIYSKVSSKVKTGLNEYKNAYAKATSAINVGLSSATAAIAGVNNLMTYPARFEDNIKNKVGMLGDQLSIMKRSVSTLQGNLQTNLSSNNKKIYQNNNGVTLLAVVLTVINPLSAKTINPNSGLTPDYNNATDVLNVLDVVTAYYNDFVKDINELQSDSGGEIDSFIPDSNLLMSLTSAINLASSNLLDIAVNSKKQRSIILNYSTNIIELTHRLYGLQPDDSTIQQLINENNLSVDDLIQIPANTLIYYYV